MSLLTRHGPSLIILEEWPAMFCADSGRRSSQFLFVAVRGGEILVACFGRLFFGLCLDLLPLRDSLGV